MSRRTIAAAVIASLLVPVICCPRYADAQDEAIRVGSLVVVTADEAPLKVKREVRATAKKGDRLKVVKSAAPWLWVEYPTRDGVVKGWVLSKNVKVARAVGKPTPPREEEPSPRTETEDRPTRTTASRPSTASPSWPGWHGPNRDNISTETGLLKEWPAGGPKVLWTAQGMGQGYGSVAVVDGLIYAAGNVDGEMKVIAVDLNGEKQWDSTCGAAYTKSYPGSRGTPAVDGGRVYYETPSGDVVCLDAKTGRKQWSVNIIQKFRGKNIGWALSESVLVDGNNVICQPGGSGAGVVALSKSSGDTVWTCRDLGDKPGYASPIIVDYKGLRQIVTMTGAAAVGINAKTGSLLWRHAHPTKYDANIPDAVFHDGFLFIVSGYGAGGQGLKLEVSGTRARVSREWTTKELDNHHGGVIHYDGYLYGSASRKGWLCLDLKTGRTEYNEGGLGKGSATFAGGMLYVLNERAEMGLVEATPRGHKVVSRARLPRGGSGQSWAHPVVCGGRLYVRHGDALHAFDIKAE